MLCSHHAADLLPESMLLPLYGISSFYKTSNETLLGCTHNARPHYLHQKQGDITWYRQKVIGPAWLWPRQRRVGLVGRGPIPPHPPSLISSYLRPEKGSDESRQDHTCGKGTDSPIKRKHGLGKKGTMPAERSWSPPQLNVFPTPSLHANLSFIFLTLLEDHTRGGGGNNTGGRSSR